MAAKITALKITPATYEVYLASTEPDKHPLAVVNNLFLVNDPTHSTIMPWLWFDERDFRANYEWVKDNPQSSTAFSEVRKVETDEE